ncbi:VOC family protein [Paracoccus suum]|uniref:VOC family protein n=1 Tax=Paracoccus suum TaxID=2259340 RepID=A0A344PM66_9RHOB|nr:VOC family protein [Paracoccus suum]AXC50471.1 VOC family protein [Paracoccus suum]
MSAANALFDMNAAPMRIGTVRLKVRDLDTVAAFYRKVLGLEATESGAARTLLGTGRTPLLELQSETALVPRDPRQAGLFHTAFLMPSRADLCRWVAHVVEAGVPLQGASDHIVSEALYLADPEGNGIEVYADRPFASWATPTGEVRLSTDPLDVRDLLASAAGTAWTGFPERGCIGHVHLQVGETEAADRFYRDILGFDIATRYTGASFYGSGGYHHQLAGNVWNSRHAGKRPAGMAGLDAVGIVVRDGANLDAIAARAETAGLPVTQNPDGLTFRDPWGTKIRLNR